MKHDGRLSLNAQLLLVQLLSLCLALAVFFCGLLVGRTLLNDVYLSDEACLKRELRYVQSLSSYVEENGLRSTDSEALRTWARQEKYVYLSVYQGEHPILETDGYDVDVLDKTRYNAVSNTLGADSLLPDEDGYYRVQFADGVFRVGITEFSETLYYDLSVMAALALACVVLLAVNLYHNSRVTRAIVRLSREVQWVEQGSQGTVIRSDRKDEIGELAQSVERMRRAIIQQMQNEQDAWQANSGLITAISHDIRTPLTALIGYLDLLEGGQYQNEEQMHRYLSASREKAQQLKVLTDELFRYFLVFEKKCTYCRAGEAEGNEPAAGGIRRGDPAGAAFGRSGDPAAGEGLSGPEHRPAGALPGAAGCAVFPAGAGQSVRQHPEARRSQRPGDGDVPQGGGEAQAGSAEQRSRPAHRRGEHPHRPADLPKGHPSDGRRVRGPSGGPALSGGDHPASLPGAALPAGGSGAVRPEYPSKNKSLPKGRAA